MRHKLLGTLLELVLRHGAEERAGTSDKSENAGVKVLDSGYALQIDCISLAALWLSANTCIAVPIVGTIPASRTS
jgi:hypothetical protein